MCLNKKNICWNSTEVNLIQRVQVHVLASLFAWPSSVWRCGILRQVARWLQQFWTSPLWIAMCRRKDIGIQKVSQNIKNNISQKSHENPFLHFIVFKWITQPIQNQTLARDYLQPSSTGMGLTLDKSGQPSELEKVMPLLRHMGFVVEK